MKKRTVAILLSFVLCVSLIGTAFAEVTLVPDGNNGQMLWDSSWGDPPSDENNPPPPPPVNNDYNDYTTSDPTYTVTNGSSSNPNGSWSTDRTSATKGTTVTITVKPNDGYQGAPEVKDKSGNTVPVTSIGGNKYTFVMPDGGVTVSVAFTPVPVNNPFADVTRDAYFYDAVLWAVSKGITTGTSATTFSPYETCTRAQTVTFLWRAAGSPAPASSGNPFTDMAPDAYYYHAVLWAVEQGITNGTSGTTFSPDATVTRGQTVTFLFRAAKAQAVEGSNPFVDVAAGEYYADAVQWAVSKNITNGTSATTFGPSEGCTRGQIVTFLYRDMV